MRKFEQTLNASKKAVLMNEVGDVGKSLAKNFVRSHLGEYKHV